ncbi:MAG TPA: NAD(P)H-dependent oxidoreductase, partial [Candidatus Hydrogenedentes bacterium]|nr:NAD(P)H-dependent oxidoreductase [Candidatus Hydrogenedentota bacterium]
MSKEMTRRAMLAAAGAGAALGAAAQDAPPAEEKILIIGVSGSPRKGKTTATAMAAALEAAKGVDPRITTELVDLGGMKIAGSDGTSSSAGSAPDDFDAILPLLKSPNLGG